MRTFTSNRLSLPLLALVAACNVVSTGDEGVATFTTEDCGQAFCSLDEDLAAGTSVDVTLGLTGEADSHAGGLTLVSDDPAIAVVVPLASPVFSRWQVRAVRGGTARLVVLAGDAYVDAIDLHVTHAARLALVVSDGPAFSSESGRADQALWHFPAGEQVGFRVRPVDWTGAELMGRMNLTTELDAPLADALTASANLPEGRLTLRAMWAGDYAMTLYAPDGLLLDVFFEVR